MADEETKTGHGRRSVYEKREETGTYEGANWQELFDYLKMQFGPLGLKSFFGSANPPIQEEYTRRHWIGRGENKGFGELMILHADRDWSSFKFRFFDRADRHRFIEIDIDCSHKNARIEGSYDNEPKQNALFGAIKKALVLIEPRMTKVSEKSSYNDKSIETAVKKIIETKETLRRMLSPEQHKELTVKLEDTVISLNETDDLLTVQSQIKNQIVRPVSDELRVTKKLNIGYTLIAIVIAVSFGVYSMITSHNVSQKQIENMQDQTNSLKSLAKSNRETEKKLGDIKTSLEDLRKNYSIRMTDGSGWKLPGLPGEITLEIDRGMRKVYLRKEDTLIPVIKEIDPSTAELLIKEIEKIEAK